MESTTGRAYGRVVWKDRWLAAVYWFAISEVLLAVGASGLLAPFFELAIIVPLIVGLLGVFIALLMLNRKRNKRITENHAYKLQILLHIRKLLGTVDAFCTRLDILFRTPEWEGMLGNRKLENVTNLTEIYREEYLRVADLIKELNANTFAPTDIRQQVLRLVENGHVPITGYQFDNATQNAKLVEALTKPLADLINSEYFTKDSDDDVKKWWNSVDNARKTMIRECLGDGEDV